MHELNTRQKALTLNLDAKVYGTFAEIGAGQEIARWFFRVGGAAGTVAKTMSAYDMTVSDAIYGKCSRYVSRDRLMSMLEHEYGLLVQRLGPERGDESTFFTFADTVSARAHNQANECHGWLGLRFQATPNSPPNDIILHVNMLDRKNITQQEALGVLGVNLMYAAFYKRSNIDEFLQNLLHELSVERIEIDVLDFHGPEFENLNRPLIGIKLVQLGLTDAIIFSTDKKLLQPSEVLHNRTVLIERGAFRALHGLKEDTITKAISKIAGDMKPGAVEPVSMVEVSVSTLDDRDRPSDENLLKILDSLVRLGHRVMISNFREFFPITAYIKRYTDQPLGFVMGVSTLVKIFYNEYYSGLEGRLLEALGRLFASKVRLYVYPMNSAAFNAHLQEAGIVPETWAPSGENELSVVTIAPPGLLRKLYEYLVESGYIRAIN